MTGGNIARRGAKAPAVAFSVDPLDAVFRRTSSALRGCILLQVAHDLVARRKDAGAAGVARPRQLRGPPAGVQPQPVIAPRHEAPTASVRSSTTARTPRRPSSAAAAKPAGPAPTTTASCWFILDLPLVGITTYGTSAAARSFPAPPPWRRSPAHQTHFHAAVEAVCDASTGEKLIRRWCCAEHDCGRPRPVKVPVDISSDRRRDTPCPVRAVACGRPACRGLRRQALRRRLI